MKANVSLKEYVRETGIDERDEESVAFTNGNLTFTTTSSNIVNNMIAGNSNWSIAANSVQSVHTIPELEGDKLKYESGEFQDLKCDSVDVDIINGEVGSFSSIITSDLEVSNISRFHNIATFNQSVYCNQMLHADNGLQISSDAYLNDGRELHNVLSDIDARINDLKVQLAQLNP